MARDFNRQVGGILRLLRHNLGLSMAAISPVLGVSHQQIDKYERGINRLPPEKLWTAAWYFGISPAGFFHDYDADTADQQAFLDMLVCEHELWVLFKTLSPQARRALLATAYALAEDTF
ncbi:MAG: helix-turn-helix domain-containing protein [Bdellovibrionales bacterium]